MGREFTPGHGLRWGPAVSLDRMSGSLAIDTGDLPAGPSYAAVVRRALIVGALLVSLLPGPVTALGVLPAYRTHARFLVFYAPLVCLLVLGYLFYVRDTLARVLFADILDPPGAPDPYYHQAASASGSDGCSASSARSPSPRCPPCWC